MELNGKSQIRYIAKNLIRSWNWIAPKFRATRSSNLLGHLTLCVFPTPRLVLQITVDQLRGNLAGRYANTIPGGDSAI